jgi:hypothetical protein
MDSFLWTVLISTLVLGLAFGVTSVLVMLRINRRAQQSLRYRSAVLAKPGPPPIGMRAVRCPRCDAQGNIPADKTGFECWQCHLFVSGGQGPGE